MNFAVKHGKKMPAPFFWSQVEKDAQIEAKASALKAVHASHLEVTKDDKKAAKDSAEAAKQRKKIERAKV